MYNQVSATTSLECQLPEHTSLEYQLSEHTSLELISFACSNKPSFWGENFFFIHSHTGPYLVVATIIDIRSVWKKCHGFLMSLPHMWSG